MEKLSTDILLGLCPDPLFLLKELEGKKYLPNGPDALMLQKVEIKELSTLWVTHKTFYVLIKTGVMFEVTLANTALHRAALVSLAISTTIMVPSENNFETTKVNRETPKNSKIWNTEIPLENTGKDKLTKDAYPGGGRIDRTWSDVVLPQDEHNPEVNRNWGHQNKNFRC